MNTDLITILGVKIDNLSKQQALEKISTFLESKKQYKILTPNPEMIVDAQKDEYFREILNEGDLNLCDGFGLKLISKGRLERISGTDFTLDICKLAEQKKYSVYFLGSANQQVISNLKLVIKNKFPNLKIAGAHPGSKITSELKNDRMILNIVQDENNEIISDIVMSAPDILFVAFGHGKQEKWIHENLKDLPSIKVAMGVGGAFDYLSGKIKRAPKFMRDVGFEWLYRLVQEPRRLKRIWKATVIFLYFYYLRYVIK